MIAQVGNAFAAGIAVATAVGAVVSKRADFWHFAATVFRAEREGAPRE